MKNYYIIIPMFEAMAIRHLEKPKKSKPFISFKIRL